MALPNASSPWASSASLPGAAAGWAALAVAYHSSWAASRLAVSGRWLPSWQRAAGSSGSSRWVMVAVASWASSLSSITRPVTHRLMPSASGAETSVRKREPSVTVMSVSYSERIRAPSTKSR